MPPSAVPQELISRFRAVSLERLERLEAAWATAVQEPGRALDSSELLRDLHTLKGDARVVGFVDVNLLSHRLEDLVVVAYERDFHLPEDFDLVVTMGLRFLAVLLRKKAGRAVRGIDLDGFVRQVDEVLEEARRTPTARRSPGAGAPRVAPAEGAATDHLAPGTLQRLAEAATAIWLEWQAGGRRSLRLRGVFDELSGEIARLSAVPLEARLSRHGYAVLELGRELGKHVQLRLDLADLQVTPQVAEVVDTAVMHTLRNALDHGVESSAARARAGKPELAHVTVTCREHDERLCVVIEDDGAGVDLELVRARALELGLSRPADAGWASEARLLELLFAPGFSTRREISELSGRGMGLAAVRAGLEQLGGQVRLEQVSGQGTRVTLSIAREQRTLEVRRIEGVCAGRTLVLALPTSWAVADHPGATLAPGRQAVDAVAMLGLGEAAPGPARLLALARAGQEVWLRVSGMVGAAVCAERMCATAEDQPCEVLRQGGEELLLVRPEVLAPLLEVPS